MLSYPDLNSGKITFLISHYFARISISKNTTMMYICQVSCPVFSVIFHNS